MLRSLVGSEMCIRDSDNTEKLLKGVNVCANIAWKKQDKAFGELRCKITSETLNFKDYESQISPSSQQLMNELHNAVNKAITLYLKNKKIHKEISVSIVDFQVQCLVISFALEEGDQPWSYVGDTDLLEIISNNVKEVFESAVFVELSIPRNITMNNKQYLNVCLSIVLSSENTDFTTFVKEFEKIYIPKENAGKYLLSIHCCLILQITTLFFNSIRLQWISSLFYIS